jgi:hypothetical protein
MVTKQDALKPKADAMSRLSVALVLFFAGCSSNVMDRQWGDRLPADWDLRAIAKVATGGRELPAALAGAEPEVLILTWKTWHGPPLNASCIVWVHWAEPSGRHQLWRLVHLCFSDPNGSPWWQRALVFDAPFKPAHEFDHAPNNKEVYAFMRETWWYFSANDDWWVMPPDKRDLHPGDAAVCTKTWEQVIGEKPTKFYPGFPQP